MQLALLNKKTKAVHIGNIALVFKLFSGGRWLYIHCHRICAGIEFLIKLNNKASYISWLVMLTLLLIHML